jgi:hypothetical protein
MSGVEVFGFVASVVVAISLMLKNMKWLRIVNGIGAVMFAVYGMLIQSYPVMILNAFIAIADAYYLVLILREEHMNARSAQG